MDYEVDEYDLFDQDTIRDYYAAAGRTLESTFEKLKKAARTHECEAVNVGFSSYTMACRTCGKDM